MEAYAAGGNAFDESGGGCEWDGLPVNCGVVEHVMRTHRGLITEVEFRTQREGGGTRTNGMEFVRDWDDILIAPDPNKPWDGGVVIAVDVSYFKIIPGGGAPLATQVSRRALLPVPQQTTSSSNPNCLQKAVVGSPGVGRGFDANPGPNGTVFHDGAHALSPAEAANAVTLPALAGEVIYRSVQEVDARGRARLYTVDVRPTNGNFIVTYKDLASYNVEIGQQLAAHDVIGTVRPSGDPKSYIGLHVTLVKPEFYKAFRQETKNQTRQNRLGTVNTRQMFIDPLGSDSPIRCP